MGVNADNKLSMAIAIHTIKEVNHLDYNYQDYDHYKWVNYLAWKVLCYSPKYHPPSPPSTNMDENDNTSLPAIDSVSMAESPFLPDLATTNTAILEMSTNQNLSPKTVAAGTSTISNFSMTAICHHQLHQKSEPCSCRSGFGWSWRRDGSKKSEKRTRQNTGGRIEREALQRVERRAARTDEDTEASCSSV
jgi:hypothetical protein